MNSGYYIINKQIANISKGFNSFERHFKKLNLK